MDRHWRWVARVRDGAGRLRLVEPDVRPQMRDDHRAGGVTLAELAERYGYAGVSSVWAAIRAVDEEGAET